MPLRETRMPADADLILELLPPSFQYPENEAWSLHQEDVEDLAEGVKSIKRIWPLLRVMQVVVPSLRDVLRGYVWEEDGQPVGMISTLRRGSSPVWTIGNVGVLPAYRRRGIARQLVEATVQLIRAHGGEIALLDVVEGNLPAYRLYESLGFSHYDSGVDFVRNAAPALPEGSPPTGYQTLAPRRSDWQPRYALAQRITPPDVQRYEPVDIRRFRPPAILRALMPLLIKLQNVQALAFQVVTEGGETVATARTFTRLGEAGDADVTLMLDPEHEVLAPYLVQRAVHGVVDAHPAKRMTSLVRQRDSALVAAAEAAGFVQRCVYHQMGLLLR